MKHENDQKPSASSIKIEFPLIILGFCIQMCEEIIRPVGVSGISLHPHIWDLFLGSLNSVKDLLFYEWLVPVCKKLDFL